MIAGGLKSKVQGRRSSGWVPASRRNAGSARNRNARDAEDAKGREGPGLGWATKGTKAVRDSTVQGRVPGFVLSPRRQDAKPKGSARCKGVGLAASRPRALPRPRSSPARRPVRFAPVRRSGEEPAGRTFSASCSPTLPRSPCRRSGHQAGGEGLPGEKSEPQLALARGSPEPAPRGGAGRSRRPLALAATRCGLPWRLCAFA